METVPGVFCLILCKGDFLTNRDHCILVCWEVNISPEGRRTALAWSFSEPSPSSGETLPDVAGGLGQVSGLPVLFAIPTRRWAELGSVQGAAVSSCASTESWGTGPREGHIVLGGRRRAASSLPHHRPGPSAWLEWSGVLASEAGTNLETGSIPEVRRQDLLGHWICEASRLVDFTSTCV